MARQKAEEKAAGPIDPNHPPTPPPQPYLVKHSRPCKELQYAGKLVSGSPGPHPFDPGHNIVAPGQYFTAFNVYHPGTCGTVTFRWKSVEALPTLVPPSRVSPFQSL